MKKLLTIALALILAVFMTMSICAENKVEDLDPTKTNNSATANVDIKIAGKENIKTVYSVDVAWDSLEFTYNFGDADIWNPDTHEYETGATGTAGSWGDDNEKSKDIVVTNHSNAKIRATASFAGGSTTLSRNDVTATLSNPSFTVETAVGTPVDNAPNGKFTCTVSGIPSGTSDFNLGTITIKIETVSSGT